MPKLNFFYVRMLSRVGFDDEPQNVGQEVVSFLLLVSDNALGGGRPGLEPEKTGPFFRRWPDSTWRILSSLAGPQGFGHQSGTFSSLAGYGLCVCFLGVIAFGPEFGHELAGVLLKGAKSYGRP